MKYKIYAGLGGGFGGAIHIETSEFESEEKAGEYAWESAIEEYDSYDGLHGLRSVGQIIEEEDVCEDDAVEIHDEERESWLDYYVEEVKDDGVHKTHCCSVHGCKYDEGEFCPVVNGRIKQTYPCQDCKEGI